MESNQLNAHELLLHELDLREGMVYADLGIGSAAYFALTGARIVGDPGIVYGVDVQKQVLEACQSHAKTQGVYNLTCVWSDLEVYGAAKKIHNDAVDRLSLVNTLYQTEKDEHVFNEANRMLKPGGKVMIIDWMPIDAPHGPPMETRTSLDKVRQMAQIVGWKEVRSFEPSKYHYGVIFEK